MKKLTMLSSLGICLLVGITISGTFLVLRNRPIAPSAGTAAQCPTGKSTQLSLPSTSAIDAIAFVSTTEGWAVASQTTHICPNNSQGVRFTGYLLHYQNGQWQRETLPTDGNSNLLMASATDGWLSGSDTLAHFDGTNWKKIVQPLGANTAITMTQSFGANAAWGITSDLQNTRHSIAHYNGTAWVQQTLPIQDIRDIYLDMITNQDGWALGTFYPNGSITAQSAFLRYTNGQWSVAQQEPFEIDSFAMANDGTGWATSTATGNLLRYNDHKWSIADTTFLPAHQSTRQHIVGKITAVTATTAWMVLAATDGTTTLWQYTGKTWQQPVATQPLNYTVNALIRGLSATPQAPDDVWIAGQQGVTAVIIHGQQGRWEETNFPYDAMLK